MVDLPADDAPKAACYIDDIFSAFLEQSMHGIGGASLTASHGWCWEIPHELRLCATLNALEYLASYITIWMEIHMWGAEKGSCFLSQVDSTSVAGWIRKSSFLDLDPLHLELSWELATLLMDHDSCVYSQWFAEEENELTDLLPCDHHLPDSDLLTLLHSCIPKQIPKDFKICLLPQELLSTVTTWLRNLPASMQLPGTPQRSKLATGATGSSTSIPSNLPTTHSCPASPAAKSTISSVALALLYEPMMFRPTLMHHQLLHQYLQWSAPPLMLWHRPTSLTTERAPFTMLMGSSSSFYNYN